MIELLKYEDCWQLRILWWYFNLPFKVNQLPKNCVIERWGCYIDFEMRNVHFNWKHQYLIIDMPWAWRHCKHEVLLKDGSWVEYRELQIQRDIEQRYYYDYEYKLKSGEIQKATAIITIERRTWKWNWFKFVSKNRKCIEITFNKGIGESGVIGCGYDMLPNETALDCLRRMEREHKFD